MDLSDSGATANTGESTKQQPVQGKVLVDQKMVVGQIKVQDLKETKIKTGNNNSNLIILEKNLPAVE